MKSDKIKKIILAVLLLVFIYIWWSNIKLFTQSQNSYSVAPQEKVVSQPLKTKEINYKFQPAKVNPFKRNLTDDSQTAQIKQKSPNKPQPPELLSPRYSVTGIVAKLERPQAVIRFPDNVSRVITLGDSLESWIVTVINDKNVVCKHDKEYDTLWLGKTNP